MEKEVSVQITSDAAFAKPRLSGRERMQARRVRHQEGRRTSVEATNRRPRRACEVFAVEKENRQVHGKIKVMSATKE